MAQPSEFESSLYGLPIWSLYVELEGRGDDLSGALRWSESSRIHSFRGALADLLLTAPFCDCGHVYAKVVEDEIGHDLLLEAGFEAVERRRLYTCQIQEITCGPLPPSAGHIRLGTLAAFELGELPDRQGQILDVCREAFARGHSRHFTDPVLLEQVPGVEYILHVMELNFERIAPECFLVATDDDSDQICGVTVVGRKPGLGSGTYTQLLSAVRKAYRGRGIYRGLVHLLSNRLPADARLLNVTHVDNQAMQRAYRGSGRFHLADTVVLKRVFGRV